MSRRTFARRFREEVGVSPLRWLTQQRVERARQLLEETDLPLDRIAAAASLRHGARHLTERLPRHLPQPGGSGHGLTRRDQPAPSSRSRVASSRSSRALATRDRIVPTGQPHTCAASA